VDPARDLKYRRAELLAQLFLQDIGASVWTTHGDKGPFDSIAVFHTKDKKLRMVAVEVKATDQPLDNEYGFQARPEAIRALRHSNVPVLFLVVDVKRNNVYHGWAFDIRTGDVSTKHRAAVRCILPVRSASEGKEDLLRTINSQPDWSEPTAVG
jgi:hypothetical protein